MVKYIPPSVSLILFSLLYWPIFPRLVEVWIKQKDYSHGFFVPFLAGYFLWRKKETLKKIDLSPSFVGLAVMAVGVTVYLLGIIAYQSFLQYFSFLLVIWGIIYAAAGFKAAKESFFSIAYLIFMIPLPELVYNTITFRLGLFSTKLAFALIKGLGIEAVRNGNIISLASCDLVVAAPCSGLRSLVVFSAAALAIGYLFQKSVLKRTILFLAAIALAIFTNTLRLFSLAFAVEIFQLKKVPLSVHDWTGIVMTIVGFFLIYWINDLLGKKE